MKLTTVVESPFRAKSLIRTQLHKLYLNCALRDCALQGSAIVWASHGFYLNFLDDSDAGERERGIQANLDTIHTYRDLEIAMPNQYRPIVALYTDLGISEGMYQAQSFAEDHGVIVEERSLEEWRRSIARTFA